MANIIFMEVQMKTTVNYHYSPKETSKKKELTNLMLPRTGKDGTTWALMQNGTATLENSLTVSLKRKATRMLIEFTKKHF